MSDTVIVLREECILAAEGKAGRSPRITGVRRIPLEGYGNTMEQWKKALSHYLESASPEHVKLVLPASYSTARATRIPYATGKQLYRMAENVMRESVSEGVADYGLIGGDKKLGWSLCCGGASQEFLNGLEEMIQDLGLPVNSLTVPLEGYLQLLSYLKVSKNKTAIYLLFEENSVTSFLYKDGVYHYSTRSRIFSERGTLDFGTEIVRNISGMLQFYATTKATDPITDVYYAGCAADDFEAGVEGIRQMNLTVHPLEVRVPFEAKGRPEDWLTCIGAMLSEKKDMNLYKAWLEESQEEAAVTGAFWKHCIIPAATFVVCMAVFGGVSLWNHGVSREIRKMNDWMLEENVRTSYLQAEQRKQYSNELAASIRQVNQMTENLATYPDLTNAMISRIEDVSGRDMSVEVQGVDMGTGTLSFNAVSREVIDIPGYISKLESTGLFESVDYTGYAYADGEYTLALSCVLQAVEVKE